MTNNETKTAANRLAATLNANYVVAANTNEIIDWLDGDDNEFRVNLEDAITAAQKAIFDRDATETFVLIRIHAATEPDET